MEAVVGLNIPFLCLALGILAVTWWWVSKNRQAARSSRETPLPYQNEGKTGAGSRAEEVEVTNSQPAPVDLEERCQLYKELYFRLQHLENHPDIIPKAKTLLLSFLSGAIESAQTQKSTILSVEEFSHDALDIFAKRELDQVTLRWQRYLERRRGGQPRELFHGLEDAKRWLVRMAPTKFVDGAWLGHIHKIKTPFAYRSITKDAWQVLSEELGDGDLDKNHVEVYKQLLHKVGAQLPAGNSSEFIRHPDMKDIQIWQSAVIQLLISLFPHEFLPEILGFNMHFEMLTFETIVAAKELRELNIDPYYFTLHITIDNADTGHAKMAKEAVVRYLHLVRTSEGGSAAQQAWKRVQAGFVLSKCCPLDLDASIGVSLQPSPQTRYMKEILGIFESKTIASSRIHDNCRARFGGRKLAAWLEPDAFKQKDWQMEFLHWLSNTKPWVYKGDSGRSRLVQLISWGGPMFGAFTHNEVATIRAWIDSLAPQNSRAYWTFTGRTKNLPEKDTKPHITVDYPVFLPYTFDDRASEPQLRERSSSKFRSFRLSLPPNPRLGKILPLWFVHPCILESFISVPWQTTNKAGCAAVRFLRAQYGYGPETSDIAGTDETRREDSIDLIDIGMNIIATLGYPSPKSLAEVLEQWPSPFAEKMLSLSMRPQKYRWHLLGLAQAFVQLHEALAFSALLSHKSRNALLHIAEREQKSLSILIEGLKDGEADYLEFGKGYELGRQEIECVLSNH
ncbi:ABC transporter with duplicated ATPase domains [Arthroderma uncinatum]|uniref:ABC transporter with duplicated ATPase domains n=1 Tax=Arthroderma uncinatum TaxID=74035 RepID=UPI00144ABD95|nr:ABC transporter with duplicated ATPase domains [Arthroderma uncinatum]KAF3483848.1 ABC transporter with duplicated ATPase domains [Arthroderma uncinatum]